MIITSSKKQEELTGKRQVWFLITSLFTELKKVKYHQSLDISSKNHDNHVDKGPSPDQTLEIPNTNQDKVASCFGKHLT